MDIDCYGSFKLSSCCVLTEPIKQHFTKGGFLMGRRIFSKVLNVATPARTAGYTSDKRPSTAETTIRKRFPESWLWTDIKASM